MNSVQNLISMVRYEMYEIVTKSFTNDSTSSSPFLRLMIVLQYEPNNYFSYSKHTSLFLIKIFSKIDD